MGDIVSDKLDELEEMIRQGQGSLVGQELKKLRKNQKITQTHAIKFSNLARRVGLPNESLKILYPYFKADKGVDMEPGVDEILEYATSLNNIGAVHEGMQHLGKVTPEQSPQVLLYKAFGHFWQWNYGEAIPLLEQYIAMNQVNKYSKLIGQFNLSVAYFYYGRIDDAYPLLDEIIHYAKEKKYDYLEGASLLMLGEVFVVTRQFREAQKAFEKAALVLKKQTNAQKTYLRKWQLLCELYEKGLGESTYKKLKQLQVEAFKLNDYETVRNIDHHSAILEKDTKLLLYLYIGTPFKGLKEKILEDIGHRIDIPKYYYWNPKSKKQKTKYSLDLITGEGSHVDCNFKVSSNTFKCLNALCGDFYRPYSIAQIHELIFPDEYYNPHSSPYRVRMVINRLNKQFKQFKIPLEVQNHHQQFHLYAHEPFSLKIETVNQVMGHKALPPRMQQLLNYLGGRQTFLNREAAEVFGVSKRFSTNILNELIEQGQIEKVGTGKSTRYKIPI